MTVDGADTSCILIYPKGTYISTLPVNDLQATGSRVHADVMTWGKLSASLALCEGNQLVTGGFPSQWASYVGFDVSFPASLNKRLNKQSRCR